MNCILNTHEQEELLLGYCASTLDPDTARTYERHLATCQHCAAMVEMQKMVDESLESWAPPELSPNFDQKLFARIRAEQEAAQPWWQLFFGWKPLAIAALALICVLVWTPADTELAQQNDSIKADEIEQVEKALDVMEGLQALHTPDPVATTRESL